jgi:S-adenosylmethionine synthetase
MTKNLSNIKYNLRTAEFVSPRHPDKICDQISDAILDAYIARDPDARVAVDVAGGHGKVFVTGEISSTAPPVDIEPIVKRLAGDVEIIESIAQQSSEIGRGVDSGGAGDQGIMIGYSTSETPEMLPLEYVLARDLNQFIYAKYPYDGKTQVTIQGLEIVSIVASFQNAAGAKLRQLVRDWLDDRAVKWATVAEKSEIFVNPAGDWSLGGFDADTGLTGRKLAVDNYGPRIPLGGGAFSGKDPSKVDRSAAYMARQIAIDYLKNHQAREVFVHLAYAIGVAQPTAATAIVDGRPQPILDYDLTPNGIINFLQLKRPIYENLARSGHHTGEITRDSHMTPQNNSEL